MLARLDVVNGELVGRVTGGPVCGGSKLAGVTFKVKYPTGVYKADYQGSFATTRVRIAAVGTVAVNPIDGGPASRAPTYSLVDAKTGVGLCESASALPTPAVLIAGETYRERAAVVGYSAVNSLPDRTRWFHVACADGALAKLRLFGLDPLTQTSPEDIDRRQAMLKMFTARYLPQKDYRSYTRDGTEVAWATGNAGASSGPPEAGPLEARWTKHGAACFLHGRVWTASASARAATLQVANSDGVTTSTMANEAVMAKELCPAVGCSVPQCSDPPSTKGPDPIYWTSYTVDHMAH